MNKILLIVPAVLLSASAFAENQYVRHPSYDEYNKNSMANTAYVVEIHQYEQHAKSREEVKQELKEYQKWPWNKNLFQGA